MDVPLQELPATYEWFADQIAGHHPSVIKNGKREIGTTTANHTYVYLRCCHTRLLKKKGSNRILKPIQEGARGECEVNVYKLLARTLRNSTSGDVGSESSSEYVRQAIPDKE
ncbi:unnamed protein product [Nippostrongylus brasiliensis]|uniref:Inositol polyphosphate multikinase (inferred by orthology to a human protein) n=1 Tax=Nippostrongylus brasiliensis TaxID=27835 RepID=A0A0N4XVZ5_NIPBR|nr:unnamed protein product [Nippostrongylus brasiliensis]